MIPELGAAASSGWLSSAGMDAHLTKPIVFGDKSQLVCMTLAARHRGLPVAIGAIAAFALLNLLATLFGAAVAAWLPGWVVTAAVGLLFAVFGISALRYTEDDDDEAVEEKPGHGIFATTFLLIFLAEFGDKTQIAVAGLGSTQAATAVWCGATLALAGTSLIGIYAGRRWLQRLPLTWIHRVSGVFFLILSAYALSRMAASL